MMRCGACGREFDPKGGRTCPFCGAPRLTRARSGVMKSATILISAGETEAVYRSVKQVPESLRRKLLKSTNGLNSATILIADRRGREEIARAIQNLPSSLQRRFLKPFVEEPRNAPAWLDRPAVKAGIAWLLGAGSVLLIWFVFTHKWS
ncbi:MAG TPA: hypothetical protein VMI94_08530 [Bryobacteraceae bacterium]|nr:hypothetical protein [Bryobacteraceae bacterium]